MPTIAQKSNGEIDFDERFSTFDDLKDRSDKSIGRRRATVVQSVRTRVAKCRPSPKNQEFDFVAKTVININMMLLLEKFRWECLHNFGYFATTTLLEQSMYFFCGLGVSMWIISLGLCGFPGNFPVLGQAPTSDDVQ